MVVKLKNLKHPNKDRVQEFFEEKFGKLLSVRLVFNINKKSGMKRFSGIAYLIFAN